MNETSSDIAMTTGAKKGRSETKNAVINHTPQHESNNALSYKVCIVETTLIYKEISPHRDMLTKSKIAENRAAMAVVVK